MILQLQTGMCTNRGSMVALTCQNILCQKHDLVLRCRHHIAVVRV